MFLYSRRIMVLDAGIHSREWIAPAVATYLIHRLAEGQTADGEARMMAREFDWYVVPVANPDGYEYTWTNDR